MYSDLVKTTKGDGYLDQPNVSLVQPNNFGVHKSQYSMCYKPSKI